MIELNEEQYALVEPFVKEITCDTVYVYSIIEKRQQGRIFVDNTVCPRSVLFWHYCGFAYVAGDHMNSEFNEVLLELLLRDFEEGQSRFVLAVKDETWDKVIADLVETNPKIQSRKRFRFCFNREKFHKQNLAVPDGYRIAEIDKNLIEKLQGRIIPSFSWNTSESFLNAGKGFCLIDKENNDIASTAFSSCIGNGKMDIGIETKPEYRGRGLGTIVAAQMVQYALDNGYEPGWGCDTKNLGSASIARKLGFEEIGFHSMYSFCAHTILG